MVNKLYEYNLICNSTKQLHQPMSYPMSEVKEDFKNLIRDTTESLESGAIGAYDEARKGVIHSLEGGKVLFENTYRRALRDRDAAEQLMQNNLYQTILIGIGVGVLVGYLCARRKERDS